jgi:putative hydrolase of the HAD superfamily
MNVVFDFGVVLFTWEPDQFLPDYFPKRAATPVLAKALATDVFSHADWHAFDQGTVSSDEVIQRTSARLGLDASVLGQLVAAIPDLLTPVAGTLDILHRLARRRSQHQDIRLFYLSNMPVPIARVLEQRHDFLGVFDGGIFSGDVKRVKPQAEIYDLLQRQFALQAEETLFIDDLQRNVEAARACGWQAVQFVSPEQLHQDLERLL